jgi:hypothetical protein
LEIEDVDLLKNQFQIFHIYNKKIPENFKISSAVLTSKSGVWPKEF